MAYIITWKHKRKGSKAHGLTSKKSGAQYIFGTKKDADIALKGLRKLNPKVKIRFGRKKIKR